jgi:hypothetical protein
MHAAVTATMITIAITIAISFPETVGPETFLPEFDNITISS